ncbi:MAG: sulfatase-like hydrolase/transferase [Lachnospiraceae bacterium]|nr:sulfatase-like hydrolase/transferase [Lachnospiraceae bacterium]
MSKKKKKSNDKPIEKSIKKVVDTEEDEIIDDVKEASADSAKDNETAEDKAVEGELSLSRKKKIGKKIKKAFKYSIHTWIFRCFLCALLIELVLEMLGRRSILGGLAFIFNSPIVYLYNVSIIFFTLLFALFIRKRIFGIALISIIWLICGVINFIVLGFRVTPFAAVDFLMVKDTFSMIDVYYTKFQQVLILAGIILVLIGIVVLFKKTPKYEGQINVKLTMLSCVIAWGIVWGFTNFGVKHNIISDDFANLGMAYQEYGFAYCFTNSIIDNGISKPDDYSKENVMQIKAELDKIEVKGKMRKPNIIIIQLESFFDPNGLKGLTMSEDPVPNFNKFKDEYPSGYFTVPALGAGTANSEFEVLTGIKSTYFGAGEYPYKTTVNDTPVVSLCSLLADQGYATHAIHNNKSSFYDRNDVYNTMGFDDFTSLEYMYDLEYTSTGWAKDYTLTNDILKCLDSSEGEDFVFTISVQGHGRYPDGNDTCEDHIQIEYTFEESMEEPFHYYVNQIYEMDEMMGQLKDALDERGEDYILILYGDHLPSLNISQHQLSDSTLFQTEYVIVNNINLDMPDEDMMSNEISGKLLNELNIPSGYAQKAHDLYEGDELDDKLEMIAYDELFGENYIYDGHTPVPERHMKMGITPITVDELKSNGNSVSVIGENFNSFSVVFVNDRKVDTSYISGTELIIESDDVSAGDEVTVKQVDAAHHELSETNMIVYQ